MAEKAPAKAKRRVKNPETFRERAVKTSEQENKPKKKSILWRILGSILRPIGVVLKKFFHLPPLRFIGRILKKLIPRYFVNSWKELKLVTWPTWKESQRLTTAVVIFAVVFGVVIALVDVGLDKIFKHLLLK